MRNLIIGDISRILRKLSFWIIFAVLIILTGVELYLQYDIIWNGFAFMGRIISYMPEILSLLLGMVLFIGVYADEMSSMAMITVIGRGLSRRKVILAKFIDTAILSAVFMALYALVIFISSLVLRADMTGYQAMALYLAMIKVWLSVIMELSVAAMVLFLTSNTALGVFGFIFMNLIMPIVIILVEMIPAVGDYYHLNRYTCAGFSSRVYTQLMLGFPGGALISFLLGFTLYIGLPLLITILVYEKKEMDF